VNLIFAVVAFTGGALLPARRPSRVKPRLDIPGVLLVAGAGLFGTFLFLTYYLQQTLGYSPLVTGVAFLPFSAGSAVAPNLATIVLMPRFGPKPLVASGMAAASAWLAQLGPHTGYAAGVLGRSSWPPSA